jgi:ABC-type Fe3+ transport system substrate-binding protein
MSALSRPRNSIPTDRADATVDCHLGVFGMATRTTRRQLLSGALLATGGSLLAACSQPSPGVAPTAVPPATTPPAPAATPTALAAATSAQATVAPATTTQPTAAGGTAPSAARPGAAVPDSDPRIAELYDAAKREGQLAWWDAHPQDLVQQFTQAFNKRFPNIEIAYTQNTEDVIKTKVVQEARAGHVSVDLVDTGQNWLAFKDAGIVDAKTDYTDLLQMAGVEQEFIVDGTCSPEFNVYGCAYNTDLVKPSELPDTLDGFSDARWKGMLAVESRLRPYVYGTPFLGGEDAVVDMLQRLRANTNPRPTDGDSASNSLLIAGEFPVLIGAYLQRYIDMKNKPWGFVNFKQVWSNVPRQGYVVPVGAAHPNASKLFMWWFVGPEGQALTDSVRFKGNPAPGTGTGPSKYLGDHHIEVKFSPLEYDLNYDTYLRKYLGAFGMPAT